MVHETSLEPEPNVKFGAWFEANSILHVHRVYVSMDVSTPRFYFIMFLVITELKSNTQNSELTVLVKKRE